MNKSDYHKTRNPCSLMSPHIVMLPLRITNKYSTFFIRLAINNEVRCPYERLHLWKSKMAKKKLMKHPRVSTEFRDILPPLSQSEFKALEADILEKGILQPILTWNNVCIDGMHRLKIAKKYKLKYSVKVLKFNSKEEAKVWIFEHQVGRRNQTTFGKVMAGLQFEEFYSRQAKENQRLTPGRGNRSPKVGKPINTTRLIAEKVGVAHSYISDVKFILQHGSKTLIQKCKEGDISIRNAYFRCQDERRFKGRKKAIGEEQRFTNPKAGKYINEIIKGDCLKVMPKMIQDGLKGKIQCIITSPPYNHNKQYGKNHDDNLPYAQYMEWLGEVIAMSSELLCKGGRLIMVIASVGNRQDDDGDSYYHPLYVDLITKVRNLNCGLKLRESIIWDKGDGGSRNTLFGSYLSPSSMFIRTNHEYVVVWSKDQWALPNKSDSEIDITKEEFKRWTQSSVWTINPNTPRSANHPAPFNEKLVERLIKLYTFKGKDTIIMDMFCGSGTTTTVCNRLGRSWIGIDQNGSYCRYAKKRTLGEM